MDSSAPGAYAPSSAYAGRPTSVTVLSTLGIILGALGLLGKPASLAIFVIKMPMQHPVVEVMRNDSFIRGWMILNVATGWMVSLLLLMASIGSLRLRDWGRTGMLAYAGLALVMTVIGQAVGLLAINPVLEPAMQQAMEQQPSPSPFQPGPTASVIIAVVLGLWFPLLIAYFFTRRPEKEAFEQGVARSEAVI